jgi:proteasome lid subunit RPN8/RPN11
LKVSIGPNAWAEIKRLVQAAQGANEIGGALLGFAYPWSDTVHVTRALPPAASAVYGAHSIDGHIDRAAITQILNEGPQGLQVVGAHHSHCTGDTELSGADMQAMADNRLVAGIKNPIELVVTSKAGSWSQLLTQVWMLTDTDDRAYDLDIKVADTTRPLS